jgi:heme exporter protein A
VARGADIGQGSEDRVDIEVRGLTVVRGRVRAIGNVSLNFRQGETIALMGPNGAGKSTLLKCLAGALRPQSGGIFWNGTSIAGSSAARRRTGYVGHDVGLYRELTAAENLRFASRMHGIEAVDAKVRQLLDEAGLEWASEIVVGKLSHGISRRVAILRAMVHEPQLILLDEPFASLDHVGKEWLERRFGWWRQSQRIVCFAGHDDSQSRQLADRIVWLEQGRIELQESLGTDRLVPRWSA